MLVCGKRIQGDTPEKLTSKRSILKQVHVTVQDFRICHNRIERLEIKFQVDTQVTRKIHKQWKQKDVNDTQNQSEINIHFEWMNTCFKYSTSKHIFITWIGADKISRIILGFWIDFIKSFYQKSLVFSLYFQLVWHSHNNLTVEYGNYLANGCKIQAYLKFRLFLQISALDALYLQSHFKRTQLNEMRDKSKKLFIEISFKN